MGITWKHKDWQTFKGIWLITSNKLTDEQIVSRIKSDPDHYGNFEDWEKTE